MSEENELITNEVTPQFVLKANDNEIKKKFLKKIIKQLEIEYVEPTEIPTLPSPFSPSPSMLSIMNEGIGITGYGVLKEYKKLKNKFLELFENPDYDYYDRVTFLNAELRGVTNQLNLFELIESDIYGQNFKDKEVLTPTESMFMEIGKKIDIPETIEVLKQYSIFLTLYLEDFINSLVHITKNGMMDFAEVNFKKFLRKTDMVSKEAYLEQLSNNGNIQGLTVTLKKDKDKDIKPFEPNYIYTPYGIEIFELIKALVELNFFKETQDEVVQEFAKFFHIELLNHDSRFQDLTRRDNKFLDLLKSKLENWTKNNR